MRMACLHTRHGVLGLPGRGQDGLRSARPLIQHTATTYSTASALQRARSSSIGSFLFSDRVGRVPTCSSASSRRSAAACTTASRAAGRPPAHVSASPSAALAWPPMAAAAAAAAAGSAGRSSAAAPPARFLRFFEGFGRRPPASAAGAPPYSSSWMAASAGAASRLASAAPPAATRSAANAYTCAVLAAGDVLPSMPSALRLPAG